MPKLPQYPANRSEQTGLRIHPGYLRPKDADGIRNWTSRSFLVTIQLTAADFARQPVEIEIELTKAEYVRRDARLISRKVVNAIAETSTICTVDPEGRISYDQPILDNWRHNAVPELFEL